MKMRKSNQPTNYNVLILLKRITACILVMTMLTALIPGNFCGSKSAYAAENVQYGQNDTYREFKHEGYETSFSINGTWWSGYNVSAIIRNTTAMTIDNWTVFLQFDGTITNIWDAVIKEHDSSNNTYILTNAGYNEDILPYSTVQFGFTVNAVENSSNRYPLPTECDMLQKEEELQCEEYSVRWAFSDPYNGILYIKNTSDVDICDWSLAFDTDIKLTGFYTAETLSTDGNHISIKNRGYNSDIRQGEELALGFGCYYVDGSTALNADLFRNFALTDVRGLVGAPVVTPEPTEEPTVTPEPTIIITPEPTEEPTVTPEPTIIVTPEPTDEPTVTPEPTIIVTPEPTEEPTVTPEPTMIVTPEPTEEPTTTPEPTIIVTPEPTEEPTVTPEPTIIVTPEPTEDPTATPEPTEIPEEDEYIDSDGDGLPDIYEDELGTDKRDKDTDHDGISDMLEFVNGLDPLVPDESFETDNDMDSDGLTDSEELYVYMTDPLNPDSDNDGLSDGFEIRNGFDPLNGDSDEDGIPDVEEKIMQEVAVKTDDMPLDYHINGLKPGEVRTVFGEERIIPDNILAVTEVSVEMETNGELEKQVEIENIYGTHVYFTNVSARVGFPVDISCDAEFDTAVITFSYDESQLGGAKEENLVIAWFNDDENCFEILENSEVDTENNTISCVTTHFSKYSVFDIEEWERKLKEAYDKAANDFRVLDGNQSIAVVLDTGSEFFRGHTELVKDELISFGEAKKDGDSIAMDVVYDKVDDISNDDNSLAIGEDGKIYTVIAEKSDPTSDLMVVKNSFEEIKYRETAAMAHDELTFLLDYYNSQKKNLKTYVIWITGSVLDTENNAKAQKALDEIAAKGIVLYQLGISDRKKIEQDKTAENIRATGGNYYYIFGQISNIEEYLKKIEADIAKNAKEGGDSNYDVIFMINEGESILKSGKTLENIKNGVWQCIKRLPSGVRIGLVKVYRELNRTVELGEGVTLSNRSSTGNFTMPSEEFSFFETKVKKLEAATFPVENQSLATCFFPKYGFEENDTGTKSVLYITGTPITKAKDIQEQIDSGIPLYVIYVGNELSEDDRDAMDAVIRQTGGRAEYIYDTTKYRSSSEEQNFKDAMTCMKMACLGVEKMGHDTCIDGDFDGVPDAIELNGMLLPDLNFVYTDPHKGDTDGDRIDDGKEIGYTEITYDYWKNISNLLIPEGEDGNVKIAFCASAKSNPTMVDSDGDGYKDNGRNDDGQFVDPRPLESDVQIYKIRDYENYVPIEDEKTGNIYYGGAQRWFSEEAGYTNEFLRKKGCGIVACEDLLIYLALEDKKYLTIDIQQFFNSIELSGDSRKIFKEEFKNWGRDISNWGDNTLFNVSLFGLWLSNMKNGLNAYFEKNNISLSAYINYTNSATIIPTQYDLSFGGTTKTENNIKLMLDRDFPVIIAIGIMEGVTLYYDNPNEIIKKPLQIDRFQFEIYDEYDAHNVTITEFITDEISQKKWMKVQSWGEIYCIDYNEWINKKNDFWDGVILLK